MTPSEQRTLFSSAVLFLFGGETALTAEVPPALVSQPGDVAISVKNPDDPRSMEVRATFRVLPTSGH